MNIFGKVFCRVYQFAFKVAMPLLPYRQPKPIDSIGGVAKLLEEKKVDSVLLVTDASLRNLKITLPLEESLAASGIKCAVYDGTRPNPTVSNVEEARALYIKENCKCIIAFGGGSPMDCAKAVGARIAYPKKPLSKLKGLLRVLRRIPMLIAVPTTAGTGSETTVTAVITDESTKHKYTMNNFTTIPHYAVLDAAVTYTLPPALTATTGMDALTHAVEAYIGNSTTKDTRANAKEAVKLVFANIGAAYKDGSNHEARANMLRAAYVAGLAFTKSYVGYIHAVAHSLGGEYNVPHGFANAVIMPHVLDIYGTAAHKKLHELGVVACVASENDSHECGAKKFIAAIRKLNSDMGIPTHIPEIRKEDIPKMAKHAASEANPLYPVPVLMDKKELEKIYESVMEK